MVFIVIKLDCEVNNMNNNEKAIYNSGYDTGYTKGVNDGLACSIDGMHLKLDDFLIYNYDKNKETLANVNNAVGRIHQYSGRVVFAVPDSASLKSCNIAELENIVAYISKMIEEFKQKETVNNG